MITMEWTKGGVIQGDLELTAIAQSLTYSQGQHIHRKCVMLVNTDQSHGISR